MSIKRNDAATPRLPFPVYCSSSYSSLRRPRVFLDSRWTNRPTEKPKFFPNFGTIASLTSLTDHTSRLIDAFCNPTTMIMNFKRTNHVKTNTKTKIAKFLLIPKLRKTRIPNYILLTTQSFAENIMYIYRMRVYYGGKQDS